MCALNDSVVFRGGVLSPKRRTRETSHIEISACETLGVRIAFSIASKGGGFTHICVEIEPRDFRSLVKFMSESHRAKAMRVMSSELKRVRNTRRRRKPDS